MSAYHVLLGQAGAIKITGLPSPLWCAIGKEGATEQERQKITEKIIQLITRASKDPHLPFPPHPTDKSLQTPMGEEQILMHSAEKVLLLIFHVRYVHCIESRIVNFCPRPDQIRSTTPWTTWLPRPSLMFDVCHSHGCLTTPSWEHPEGILTSVGEPSRNPPKF